MLVSKVELPWERANVDLGRVREAGVLEDFKWSWGPSRNAIARKTIVLADRGEVTRVLGAEEKRDELSVASVGDDVDQLAVRVLLVDGLEAHAEASIWLNDSSHASDRASRKELPDGRRSITLILEGRSVRTSRTALCQRGDKVVGCYRLSYSFKQSVESENE